MCCSSLAVAIHAPIGLRNILREWTPWRGRSLDVALALFAFVLLALGLRAALAVYLPPEAARMMRASHRQPGFLAALCIGSPASRSRCSCRSISWRCPAR